MFKINDYTIYGSTGVCQITDIRNEKLGNALSKKYYIIKPIYSDNSTIYAPVGTSESRMKKILSPDEVHELIDSIPDEKDIWVDEDNIRRQKYSEIIKNGDRTELIKLIKTLYNKRDEKTLNGKKIHATDEKFMKDAEKLLYEEFAHVLNIKPAEVIAFITEKLGILLEESKDGENA